MFPILYVTRGDGLVPGTTVVFRGLFKDRSKLYFSLDLAICVSKEEINRNKINLLHI